MPNNFRVGLLSDGSMILENQETPGRLNAEETEVLVEYIREWDSASEDDEEDFTED